MPAIPRDEFDPRVGLPAIGFEPQWQLAIRFDDLRSFSRISAVIGKTAAVPCSDAGPGAVMTLIAMDAKPDDH